MWAIVRRILHTYLASIFKLFSTKYMVIMKLSYQLAMVISPYLCIPLRAIFFRWNINIYLHYMTFLHNDMTQVVENLVLVRQ